VQLFEDLTEVRFFLTTVYVGYIRGLRGPCSNSISLNWLNKLIDFGAQTTASAREYNTVQIAMEFTVNNG